MLSQTSLKRTPLYNEHLKLNAKMVSFGGWEMPVQYEGIIKEYHNTRKGVSVFDISHMGEFIVEGDPEKSGLDNIVTPSILNLPIKSCRYGTMLNDQGGVIDDLIVFRISKEKWMIVVNGATMGKDEKHFQKHITSCGTFSNISDKIGKLDIQGPQSRDVLSSWIKGIEKLDYYTFDEFDCLGENVIISRTGYTGELGYEIYFPWDKTTVLWQECLRKDIKPAGLGVRDILRIEMGYSLYGHELEETISPLDAGLNRFIDWEKDFIGKKSLLKEKEAGVKRKVVAFISDSRRSPRKGHKIYDQGKAEIGHVSSGTFSPSLIKGLGLGFVQKASCSVGDKILFGDENNKVSAVIAKKPIYSYGSLKK